MEGKTVILSVLIISLVMAQIQVEAKEIGCCAAASGRERYNACRMIGHPPKVCAKAGNCQTYTWTCACPHDYPLTTVDKCGTVDQSGGSVNEYCKLGCTSSVCGAMTTLQKSDASEVMNGAVEQCTKGCSTLCTEGIKTVLETA